MLSTDRQLELLRDDIASRERAIKRAIRNADHRLLRRLKSEVIELRAKVDRVIAGEPEPEPKHEGPQLDLWPERTSI